MTRESDSAQNVEEYRIRASKLLKELRSTDDEVAIQAAARLRHVPAWADHAPQEIRAARHSLRRKHALAVVAIEAGFADWAALKAHFDRQPGGQFDPALLFDRAHGVFLNRWFRKYEDAKASQDRDGGYLFPYKQHYVVCEAGLLEALGADPADPDWQHIGKDWVRPARQAAKARLSQRLRRTIG